MKATPHSADDQSGPEAFAAQFDRLLVQVDKKLPDAHAYLDAVRADLLASTGFPTNVWRQTWLNNPIERLNREIRGRTDSVGISSNHEAVVRLIDAVLAERTDAWAEGRRHLGLDLLARCHGDRTGENGNEVTGPNTPLELFACPT